MSRNFWKNLGSSPLLGVEGLGAGSGPYQERFLFLPLFLLAIILVVPDPLYPVSASTEPPPPSPSPALPPLLRVAAVGDILPGSYTPFPIAPTPEALPEILDFSRFFAGADLVLGNLEGPLIQEGMKPEKCRMAVPSGATAPTCWEFGIPPWLAPWLKKAGFQVLSLDNNHTYDYGEEGYLFTIQLLKQQGIYPLLRRTPLELVLQGITVAVVPFGFSPSSFHLSHLWEATAVVGELAKRNNLVIVVFHGGKEGKDALHVSDATEYFLGEDRGNVLRFARAVVDAGADLVLGHGPHVPRAMELYRGRLIAYSLGNFWTYGNISLREERGLAPLLLVELTPSGCFLGGTIHSFVQEPPGIPRHDPEHRAAITIQRLTREDFPDANLIVSSGGTLVPRKYDCPP